jgi:hypothetical protein
MMYKRNEGGYLKVSNPTKMRLLLLEAHFLYGKPLEFRLS